MHTSVVSFYKHLPCLFSLPVPAPLLVVTHEICNTSFGATDPHDHHEPLAAPSNNPGHARLLLVQTKSPALWVQCVFPATPPY